ncbi:MAG: DeoR/GlpR family DNA-binding transcription regulator [Niabella sp.]
MLKKERQSYILHQLNLHNKVLNADLGNALGVSEDTVRRDLQELCDAGKLIKVHGGALSTAFSEVHFSGRENAVYAKAHKNKIAQKAITLIKDGMFVLTGGGTTILEMASNLPPQLRATFLTGSVAAMNIYATYPNIETIVVGGKLSKDSRITIGSFAIGQMMEVVPDSVFFGHKRDKSKIWYYGQ